MSETKKRKYNKNTSRRAFCEKCVFVVDLVFLFFSFFSLSCCLSNSQHSLQNHKFSCTEWDDDCQETDGSLTWWQCRDTRSQMSRACMEYCPDTTSRGPRTDPWGAPEELEMRALALRRMKIFLTNRSGTGSFWLLVTPVRRPQYGCACLRASVATPTAGTICTTVGNQRTQMDGTLLCELVPNLLFLSRFISLSIRPFVRHLPTPSVLQYYTHAHTQTLWLSLNVFSSSLRLSWWEHVNKTLWGHLVTTLARISRYFLLLLFCQ